MAAVLRESGLPHRIAPPRDPARIKLALAELVRALAEGRLAPPTPQQLHRYSREYIAHGLAEAMNGCLRPARLAAGVAVQVS